MIPKPATQNPQLDNVNILIVDDDPKNIMALRELIHEPGLNIVEARSGDEALRCVMKDDFAVILLDVMMPGMDGFQTADLISNREKSSTTPIIFLTAYGKEDFQVVKGYTSGAVDYLMKPIVPEILRAKVGVFVELYRARVTLLEQKEAALKRQEEQIAEMAREMNALKNISGPEPKPASEVAGASGRGGGLKKESVEKFLPGYRKIMLQYINAQSHQDRPKTELRHLAGQLAELGATAADIVQLHLLIINEVTAKALPAQAKTVATDARLALLELMGSLTDLYRVRNANVTAH